MRKSGKLTVLLGVGAVGLFSLAGCGGNADNAASNEATAASNTASNEASAASNTVSNAGSAVDNAASNAGGAVSNMATAAVTTPAIKTALGASAALKGTDINVDTTKDAVTLTGTVKNATQKKAAEMIVKQKAPAMKLDDSKLKVTGGASPVIKK